MILSRESFFDLFLILRDRGLRRALVRLQRVREDAALDAEFHLGPDGWEP